jgi:hypothetical protein
MEGGGSVRTKTFDAGPREMEGRGTSNAPRPKDQIGRPTPSILRRYDSETGRRLSSRSAFVSDLEESLPLLSFGAVCFGLAFASLSSGTHYGPSRFPLWELFFAIGAVGTGGGVASVVAGPDLDELSTPMPDRRSVPEPVATAPARQLETPPIPGPAAPRTRELVAPGPSGGDARGPRGSILAAGPAAYVRPDSGETERRPSQRSSRRSGAYEEPGTQISRRPARNVVRDDPTAVRAELDSLLASLAGGAEVSALPRLGTGAPRACASCQRTEGPDGLAGECDRCGAALCPTCVSLGELSPGPILCRVCTSDAVPRPRRSSSNPAGKRYSR